MQKSQVNPFVPEEVREQSFQFRRQEHIESSIIDTHPHN